MNTNILYLAWAVVLVSILGSLYMSEVLGFPPCVLCWFQRIAMYPLIVILTVGIIRKSKDLQWYVLPLSIFGFALAVYHYLLQAGILPESAAPCVQGVSCLTKQLDLYGFVTIPFMSMIAFGLIIISTIIYAKHNQEVK